MSKFDLGQEKLSDVYDSAKIGSDIGTMGDMPKTVSGGQLKPTAESLARSPFGSLELSKYLYETGLQSIFDDYQKNYATLDASKQKQVQDAYYIREMSKKYAGEYASNNQIGDVSGNLIDIYSNYQGHINEINENFDALQLNLSGEYQKARNETLNNIMFTQFGIETAKLQKGAQDVMFAIESGETGDLSALEYLEKHKGSMDEATYRSIYLSLMEQENAKPETVYDYGRPTMDDGTENPYYQPNYDPSYYFEGEHDFGKGTDVYRFGGMEHARIQNDVDSDKEKKNAPQSVSSDDLFAEFQGNEKYAGKTLSDGKILDYRGIYYVFKGGKFYRLVSQMPGSSSLLPFVNNPESGQTTWKVAAGQTQSSNGMYKTSSGADTLTVNGITYKEHLGGGEMFDRGSKESVLTTEQKNIIAEFKKVHGEDFQNNAVVFYNGRFYVCNNYGKIRPMKRA